MDKPVNENGVFYPPDWKDQMRKFHAPTYRNDPRKPLEVVKVVKKKHLSEAERRRRAFRVVD